MRARAVRGPVNSEGMQEGCGTAALLPNRNSSLPGGAGDFPGHRRSASVDRQRPCATVGGAGSAGRGGGGLVAVSTSGRDELTAPENPRPGDHLSLDGLLELQSDVVSGSDVADRGDAAVQELVEKEHSADGRCCVGVPVQAHVVAALLREMDVEVDEAGHDVETVDVDRARTRGNRDARGRTRVDDPIALHHEDRVRNGRRSRAIDERSAAERENRLLRSIPRRNRNAARVVGGLPVAFGFLK